MWCLQRSVTGLYGNMSRNYTFLILFIHLYLNDNLKASLNVTCKIKNILYMPVSGWYLERLKSLDGRHTSTTITRHYPYHWPK